MPTVEALALVTDQLVTNAILHGAPPVSMALHCATSEVTIVVTSSPNIRPTQDAGDSDEPRLTNTIRAHLGDPPAEDVRNRAVHGTQRNRNACR